MSNLNLTKNREVPKEGLDVQFREGLNVALSALGW